MKKNVHAKTMPDVVLNGIKGECAYHPDCASGSAFMKVGDCCAEVFDDRCKTKLGEVNACIGGAIELVDSKTGIRYFLRYTDIFQSFLSALGRSKQ